MNAPNARRQNDLTLLFEQWAQINAIPITQLEMDSSGDADLSGLSRIVGNARVIGFGEPMHGTHEALAMRNRMIRYAITQLGVKAVGLESGIGTAKVLYDHVLGKIDAGHESLRQAFSYGFGTMEENMELLQWLRDYNGSQPAQQRVGLYAYDLTGQAFPYAYRAIEAVVTFLEDPDGELGAAIRKDCAGLTEIFRADRYCSLTQPDKDEITRKIQDVIAVLEREGPELITATSEDEYAWGLQQAIAAAQDDAFLRLLPGDSLAIARNPQTIDSDACARWERTAEMREIAMAKNIQWILSRTDGRVLIFAHNVHLQSQVVVIDGPDIAKSPRRSYRAAGCYLRSTLGADYVVIASIHGGGKDFPPGGSPRAPEALVRIFSTAAAPHFMIDLRALPNDGSLRTWFDALQALPMRGRLRVDYQVSLARAYDAIVYLGTVTPSRRSKNK